MFYFFLEVISLFIPQLLSCWYFSRRVQNLSHHLPPRQTRFLKPRHHPRHRLKAKLWLRRRAFLWHLCWQSSKISACHWISSKHSTSEYEPRTTTPEWSYHTFLLLQYPSLMTRRDIKELKDDLKDETEKRTRLQVSGEIWVYPVWTITCR